jgi:hypothetical protein
MLKKKEIIWREILEQTLGQKQRQFTQKELAERFSISLSTVFNALKLPRQSKVIEVSGRNFQIRDLEKFLYLWATHRNLSKDIIYKTNCSLSVKEIEGLVPSEVIYGAYSAYRKKYNEAPADYDKVYIYVKKNNLEEIKQRFPIKKGYENLIVLEADPWLANYGFTTPDCQTFVDLWNLEDWYAKDFLEALKEKILK